MKKWIIPLVVGGLVAVIAITGLMSHKEAAMAGVTVATADWNYTYSDVVGSHVGTTTVGVAFSDSTSTYVSVIGEKNEAIYMIKTTAVPSTTMAYLNFLVEGTNDDYCEVTTTTASGEVLKQHINWFSAMDHLKGKVHATSFGNTSSTVSLNWDQPEVGYGQEIILTDLAYNCLRLQVGGASSSVYVGIKTK